VRQTILRFLPPYLLALVLFVSSSGAASSEEQINATGYRTKAVATGLNHVAAFTFTPGGKIIYGERGTGVIRMMTPTTGTQHRLMRIPNVVDGAAHHTEAGLVGIALHPDYPKPPLVYAYATRRFAGNKRAQILRFRNVGGEGSNLRVIWSSRTASTERHDGGRILFGPDGMLWVAQGEAYDSANAQDLTNTAGKLLRMTPRGRPAPGNPFIRSDTRERRIWSYGLRNSYGFDFDPRTSNLWETENGPECNDELNRIIKGRNFGWGPRASCGGSAPRNTNNSGPKPRIPPKRWYTPTIAPTGLVFCNGCGLGARDNERLFFADFNTHSIRRVVLTSNRLRVRSQSIVFIAGSTVLSMEEGADGGIYFSSGSSIRRLLRS
jgi:glucose/arabinose dehydrogenase